jgi:hypothetical protein
MSRLLHSGVLSTRASPEVVERVQEAAARTYLKPAEYIRMAVLAALKRDGVLEAAE